MSAADRPSYIELDSFAQLVNVLFRVTEHRLKKAQRWKQDSGSTSHLCRCVNDECSYSVRVLELDGKFSCQVGSARCVHNTISGDSMLRIPNAPPQNGDSAIWCVRDSVDFNTVDLSVLAKQARNQHSFVWRFIKGAKSGQGYRSQWFVVNNAAIYGHSVLVQTVQCTRAGEAPLSAARRSKRCGCLGRAVLTLVALRTDGMTPIYAVLRVVHAHTNHDPQSDDVTANKRQSSHATQRRVDAVAESAMAVAVELGRTKVSEALLQRISDHIEAAAMLMRQGNTVNRDPIQPSNAQQQTSVKPTSGLVKEKAARTEPEGNAPDETGKGARDRDAAGGDRARNARAELPLPTPADDSGLVKEHARRPAQVAAAAAEAAAAAAVAAATSAAASGAHSRGQATKRRRLRGDM